MKLAACLAAALFTVNCVAQDFHGTIVWKMKADIADVTIQSKMQAAQTHLASPEMQAKMQEAQAALQNPEMQAMLAQNPQMKAMVEQQMAMLKGPGPGAAAGDGGESGPGGLFPRGFTLKVKGERSLVTVDGGMFQSETLTQGDLGATYLINRQEQTYRRLPADRPGQKSTPAHRITRTAETTKILGYLSNRCVVETLHGPEKATYSIWVTKEIKGLEPKRLKNLRVGDDRGPNFMDQLDGVPMRMEITTPQAKLTMEVSAVRAESLPASVFELPEGYSEAGE